MSCYIEAYPVGLLSDIKRGRVRDGIRNYLVPQIKRRNWRAVRSYFNGYLAEWHYCPSRRRANKADNVPRTLWDAERPDGDTR